MNFDLFYHTILLTRAGSRAYGTHTEASDLDLKGVAVPPKSFIIGLDRFEQADSPEHFKGDAFKSVLSQDDLRVVSNSKLEGVIYNLTKFITLAAECNPNILEVLFCDEKDILLCNDLGKILRATRDSFLSARAAYTYTGYAFNQVKRIKTHRRWLLNPPTHEPTRSEFGLLAETLIPQNQLDAARSMVKKKMDGWEIDLTRLASPADRQEVYSRIDEVLVEVVSGILTDASVEDSKWRAAVRAVGLDDNILHILEKERKYTQARDDWHKFNNWQKNRNPARAALEAKHGFDTKHGSHVFRLLIQGQEILTTGSLRVNRVGIDAEEILAIRNGDWSFERLMDFALAKGNEISGIYKDKTYVVPKIPNLKDINNVCVDILERALCLK